jgi:hypothetical protein
MFLLLYELRERSELGLPLLFHDGSSFSADLMRDSVDFGDVIVL